MCFAPLGLRCSMWDCQSSQWYARSFYFYVDLFTSLYSVCYNIVFIFFWGGAQSMWDLSSPTKDQTGEGGNEFCFYPVEFETSVTVRWSYSEESWRNTGDMSTWELGRRGGSHKGVQEGPGNGEKAQETAVSWLTGYFRNKVVYSREVQQKRGWQTIKLTPLSFSTMVGWEPGWSITIIQLNVWWLPFSTKHWNIPYHTQTPALK